MIDPPLANAQFTWSDFRDDPICCQLDRFLFTTKWEELFNFRRHEAMVRIVSDHCPITLYATRPRWGLLPFRFEIFG